MNSVFLAALVALAPMTSNPQQPGQPPGDPKAMMERWQKACEVKPQHKRLGALVGKWDVTMRMWMAGPGLKPAESKGSSEIKWLVENKWVQGSTSFTMMGMPITTTMILGYDGYKQRYVASYVDSFQTDLRTASGIFTKEDKDLVLWGFMDEPMTPESDKMVKYVYRNLGQDSWTFEVHDMMIGETNTKVAEFEFKRAK
jgi:hypothetical protein